MKIELAKTRRVEDRETTTKQRVSAYSESYKGEFYRISVDKLIPFKKQARKNFNIEELNQLAQTIKEHGIRQPLTVIPVDGNSGMYEIVSGERRWKAAKMVNLLKVPCIILDNKNAAEEIALIENVQRKDLHPIELMQGLQHLLDSKICNNQQEISDKIGIQRTKVVETLGLKKLPLETQKLLLKTGVKSRDVLRQLLKTKLQNHPSIINNCIAKNVVSNIRKKTKKQINILSISLKEENLIIKKDDFITLSVKHKEQIRSNLEKMLKNL